MLTQFRQGDGIYFFYVLNPFCLPSVTVGLHLSPVEQRALEKMVLIHRSSQQRFHQEFACTGGGVWVGGLCSLWGVKLQEERVCVPAAVWWCSSARSCSTAPAPIPDSPLLFRYANIKQMRKWEKQLECVSLWPQKTPHYFCIRVVTSF